MNLTKNNQSVYNTVDWALFMPVEDAVDRFVAFNRYRSLYGPLHRPVHWNVYDAVYNSVQTASWDRR